MHARLKNHVYGKDFWDQVVLFTSKDDNLTKAHVKYLESRVVELAQDAARIRVDNSTKPPRPALPRADRDAMEEFLGPMRILLGALGLSFLEPVGSREGDGQSAESGGPLAGVTLSYVVEKIGVRAQGSAVDEGFIVAAGSVGPKAAQSYLSPGWKRLREALIEGGDLEHIGDQIRFTRDLVFKSPSAAASIVCGGNRNGRETWRNAQGVSLKKLEEGLIGAGDEPSGE